MQSYLPIAFLIGAIGFLTACGEDITSCNLQENQSIITDGSLALDSNCQGVGALERFPEGFNGGPGSGNGTDGGDDGEPCDFRTGQNCD